MPPTTLRAARSEYIYSIPKPKGEIRIEHWHPSYLEVNVGTEGHTGRLFVATIYFPTDKRASCASHVAEMRLNSKHNALKISRASRITRRPLRHPRGGGSDRGAQGLQRFKLQCVTRAGKTRPPVPRSEVAVPGARWLCRGASPELNTVANRPE